MNCLRSCLLGCLVLASSAEAAEIRLPAKKDFHLFLLVGQSNMAGRGRSPRWTGGRFLAC
ncbi:MAG: hypothetical protein CM1200mP2_26620 [Planctomycetaceae bacterium]|nr:MAG: hypothetical protein CM1200mP2_26620 [Planctomycetaceae bacterium]